MSRRRLLGYALLAFFFSAIGYGYLTDPRFFSRTDSPAGLLLMVPLVGGILLLIISHYDKSMAYVPPSDAPGAGIVKAVVPLTYSATTDAEFPLAVGDVFLTEEALYYVPYVRLRAQSAALSGAAALLGGPIFAVAFQQVTGTSKTDINLAVTSAREADWAEPPETRTDRHRGRVVMRSEVTSVEQMDNSVLQCRTTSSSATFRVESPEDSALLLSWLRGATNIGRTVEYFQYGLAQDRLPPPAKLLSMLTSGDAQDLPSSDALERISENRFYLDKLFQVLIASKSDAAALSAGLMTLPRVVRDALIKLLAVRHRQYGIAVCLLATALAVIVLGLAYFTVVNALEGSSDAAWGGLAGIVFLGIGPAIFLYELVPKLTRVSQLKAKARAGDA